MHIFDFLEVWVGSLRSVFASAGVVVVLERSPDDRPNPSLSVNLRCEDHEVDLLIWDSGEAELSIGIVPGEMSQSHFDDVKDGECLMMVLSHTIEFILRK